MINIAYTDNSGEKHIGNEYTTEYPCEVFSENTSNEVVYITEKDLVNCTSTTTVLDGTFLFKADYIYFVRIFDLENNEVEELTRIYEIGHGAHENVYGFCESSKCKVPVVPVSKFGALLNEELNIKFHLIEDNAPNNTGATRTYDLPAGFTADNTVVLGMMYRKDKFNWIVGYSHPTSTGGMTISIGTIGETTGKLKFDPGSLTMAAIKILVMKIDT